MSQLSCGPGAFGPPDEGVVGRSGPGRKSDLGFVWLQVLRIIISGKDSPEMAQGAFPNLRAAAKNLFMPPFSSTMIEIGIRMGWRSLDLLIAAKSIESSLVMNLKEPLICSTLSAQQQ
uniref:HDC11512 n=1 Tax=Drosophila melanogaster TaxID=7227 RepID=Q6IKT3_DROME|nr:TPA_inf: HDC11512 [Drosophila melanogaster]